MPDVAFLILPILLIISTLILVSTTPVAISLLGNLLAPTDKLSKCPLPETRVKEQIQLSLPARDGASGAFEGHSCAPVWGEYSVERFSLRTSISEEAPNPCQLVRLSNSVR
ncbi:MAG: hypothetical protein H0U54_15290 [Acidobacteria bacterium]|nr:hypothetical protein [Acidobacteriota bacterium]